MLHDPSKNKMAEPLVLRSVQGAETVLTSVALTFLADLDERFGAPLRALMAARKTQLNVYSSGYLPDYLSETDDIRAGDWTVSPSKLGTLTIGAQGPADKASLSAAILSGIDAYLADLEDDTSPRFDHMIAAQENLMSLQSEATTVIVRPRGLHAQEDNLLVSGRPMAAALFDFGLHVFHCSAELSNRGTGPVYALAKLTNHREARLWNDIFDFTENRLGLEPGTIKAVPQIETLRASFEMDEIIYELGNRAIGLAGNVKNFAHSYIKTMQAKQDCVLPPQDKLTMDQAILATYAARLNAVCRRRGIKVLGELSETSPFSEQPILDPDQALTPPAAEICEADVQRNISLAIECLAKRICGKGRGLVEAELVNGADAELATAQIWQWIRHGVSVDGKGGERRLDADWLAQLLQQEVARILQASGPSEFHRQHYGSAMRIFHDAATSDVLTSFVCSDAYEVMNALD